MIRPELLVPQINTVGLVAYYKLQFGLMTAGKVFDYSLGGAVGTLNGSDIVPVFPGFSFNGTDDFIDVGNHGGTIRSIAIWVNHTEGAGNIYPLDLNGTAFISIEVSQLIGNGMGPGLVEFVDGIVGTAVSKEVWHLISMTISERTASDLDIGRVEGQGLFDGKIGEVMLFNRALPATEMRSLYELTRHRYGV